MQHFLIIDTETTMNDTVADFGAVIVDSRGNIKETLSCMVFGHFLDIDLFHDNKRTGLWAKAGLEKRTRNYLDMVNSGKRVIMSAAAINMWLANMAAKYNPALTAYNLAFDMGKCHNTGIDLSVFGDMFCLWHAAVGNICRTKKFREFALQNHVINNRTEKGNMTVQTNAEVLAWFVTGNNLVEPHTAIEDAIDFELPILLKVIKTKNWRDNIVAYSWGDFQVRDMFKAK